MHSLAGNNTCENIGRDKELLRLKEKAARAKNFEDLQSVIINLIDIHISGDKEEKPSWWEA